MEYQLKIGQLEINPDQANNSLVRVFAARSSPAKEKALGKMFGVLEAKAAGQTAEIFLDGLIKAAKNNYYRLSDGADEAGLEAIFEQALKKTNREAGDLSQETKIDFNDFNGLIAVLKNGRLHLAPVGQIGAFLIHQLRDGRNFKIINILENGEKIAGEPTPAKIFSNLISGEINPADSMIIANNNFLDYLSLDKIKKIIANLPAGAAAEQFRTLLLGVSQNHNFGALVIKSAAAPETAKIKSAGRPPAENSPQDSMAGLIGTEETTEKLLTPSLGLNIFELIKNARLSRRPAGRPIANGRPEPYRQGNYGKNQGLFQHLIKQLMKTLTMSAYLFRGLFYLLAKTPASPESGAGKTEKENLLSQKIGGLTNRLSQLSRQQKLILVGALIFVIVFSQAVVILSRRQGGKVENRQYEQLLSEIKTKQDSAEARLIFGDEDGARQLLLEARDLAAVLPKNSRQRQNDFAGLVANNEKLLAKTKKIIAIDDPAVLADFSDENRPAVYPKQIIFFDNQILTYNQSDNNLYEFNPADKQIKNMGASSGQIGHLQLGANWTESSLLFYHDGRGLAKFDSAKKIISPLPVALAERANVKDLMVYNRRLYLLDAGNNQIYKYNYADEGFAPDGEPWLLSQPDLSGAISLAIDGNAYVLKNDGEVLKFLQGREQDFTVGVLDPELNHPTKIWADIDSDFIYILDPANQRLVVLDKDGKLQAQYYSDQFDNLKDFIVRETENKIYLLNGTAVLEIPIQHQAA